MAASKKDVAKQQVKEDREKVREMYLSGKTVKEIAKETYFSSSYCYAMVRDLAKEKNLAKNALIAKRHREGEAIQALATEYNLSVSTVNTICSRNKNQNIASY